MIIKSTHQISSIYSRWNHNGWKWNIR